MAIIKCKMCGGDVVLAPDKTVGICEYCGSTMTFPRVDDEQRAAAFRRIGEFDKALEVYERIVAEDDTDAEAHWCCALCRFGIEWVEDPNTLEYVPTCHRASFDSFLEDVDYLAAVEHSDGLTRRQYQKDGAKINEVQRGILATSRNEKPFDVFICYKELDDATGERTRDSIDAQEIYYNLTQEGYRVFFSRITLEDKPGTEYEPYIFAALNSAKVMVVLGSKPEYFSAVWVRNEWSRFLTLMHKDRSKLLIPCYKNMDPYDLPDQLSVLMSYDMTRIGFMQDLLRGIRKVLRRDEPKPAVKETVVVQQSGGPNANAMVKRGQLALEDGEWERAKEFFDNALNIDAECAEAYLGIALANEQCRDTDSFINKLCADKAHVEQIVLPRADERIEAAVKKYAVPGYVGEKDIRALFSRSFGFESLEANQKRLCDQARREFKENRTIGRAFRFAKGESKKSLNGFVSSFEERLAALQRAAADRDAEARKRAENGYSAYLAEAEKKAAELKAAAEERRGREYAALIGKIDASRSVYELETLEKQLGAFEGYRDCEEQKEKIKEKAAALREETRLLREEEERERKRAKQRQHEIEQQERQQAEQKKRQREEERARQRAARADYITAATKRSGKPLVIALLALLLVGGGLTAVLLSKSKNKEPELPLQTPKPVVETVAPTPESVSVTPEPTAEPEEVLSEEERIYREAEQLASDGKIYEAATTFYTIKDYKDSWERCFSLWGEITSRRPLGVPLVVLGRKTLEWEWENLAVYDVIHVANSYDYFGLKYDGTLMTISSSGRANYEVSDWSDIVSFSPGPTCVIGLKADGTVLATFRTVDGRTDYGQCEVSGWKDVVMVSAGKYYTAGLKADGTVLLAGKMDASAKIGAWTDIVAIDSGYYYTVGLRSDGTVVAAGTNGDGQCNVSDWTDIVAIDTTNLEKSCITYGLRSDGTIVTTNADLNRRIKNTIAVQNDFVQIYVSGLMGYGLHATGEWECLFKNVLN